MVLIIGMVLSQMIVLSNSKGAYKGGYRQKV